MRVALVAVALVLLGAPRPAVAGGCRTVTISASPLSTKASVDPGGGVLIGWSNDGGDAAPALDAEVALAATPGRCRPNPPGLEVPSPGQQLQLAWVDRHGRVSARSATIEVTEATP